MQHAGRRKRWHLTSRPARSSTAWRRDNPSVTNFQRYLAGSHLNIGLLQSQTHHLAEALASFEKARAIFERLARENPSVIDFQRDLASTYSNAGGVQIGTGELGGAAHAFEQARPILEKLASEHPESADFASDLGGLLHNMGAIDIQERQFDKARAKFLDAIAWQRKALAVNPVNPTYRQFLSNHLIGLTRATEGLGRNAEADQARRELADLTTSDPAKAALDARLAAVVSGKESPKDDAERIQLAYRAYEKALHATSARLFALALANNPKLADDRQTQHAYNAACAAALAASGKGKDDPPPDEGAEGKFRAQARDWLKAELAAWAKILESGPAQSKAAVPKTLDHWKTDADLAGIRDENELTTLPENERAAFKQLWNNVDRLLAKAVGGN